MAQADGGLCMVEGRVCITLLDCPVLPVRGPVLESLSKAFLSLSADLKFFSGQASSFLEEVK